MKSTSRWEPNITYLSIYLDKVELLKTTFQDFDGWTPLHAAAHWAQREACELLTDAYVNMDIKNCVGQTPFDVADPDVLRLLEELKKKQNNCSKDRSDQYCTDFKGKSKISIK